MATIDHKAHERLSLPAGQETVVSEQIVPRDDQSVLGTHLERLVAKRACDKDLLGRTAWSLWVGLLMVFGWTTSTLAILEDVSWSPAGLIAADGGVLVIGVAILLLTWLSD